MAASRPVNRAPLLCLALWRADSSPSASRQPFSACEYLPDQVWQLRYEIRPDIRPEEYMERLRCRRRRFGPVLFRPAYPSCRMCRSLRVPVALFKPTAGQRRVWRSNHQEVTFRIGRPSMTGEKQALLDRFHRAGARDGRRSMAPTWRSPRPNASYPLRTMRRLSCSLIAPPFGKGAIICPSRGEESENPTAGLDRSRRPSVGGGRPRLALRRLIRSSSTGSVRMRRFLSSNEYGMSTRERPSSGS